MKKYGFTGETKTIQLALRTVTLHRIRAVAEFGFGLIKVGDLGGWIEKEENLSQEGEAWVWDNAKVYGNAKVCGNAKVWDNAKVYGNAEVWGNAKVYGNAEVYNNAEVWGNAEVYNNAKVCCSAKVCGSVEVYGSAEVCGSAKVWGNAEVCGNAEVFSQNHVMTIGAIGSRNDFTTFYRGKDKQIMVKCGCFNDTIDRFVEKVLRTHGNTKYARVYRAAAEVARIQIDLECKAKESEE